MSQILAEDLLIKNYFPEEHEKGGMRTGHMSSKIRITHLPTGHVVEVDKHRSQLKNKQEALQLLETFLEKRKPDPDNEDRLKYLDLGDVKLTQIDGLNVPINCFLEEDEDSPGYWSWTADNYMPRKGYIAQNQYNVKAESREMLLQVISKYVIPIYNIALESLKATGTLYHWDKHTTEVD